MKNEYHGWLDKAEEDSIACDALMKSERVPYSVVCFHAQQMAEKYLKAYLTFLNVEFRKTHDLVMLLDEYCIPANAELAKIRNYAIILCDYSINTRYPGNFYLLGITEAKEAIDAANCIKEIILKQIG